MEEDKNTTIGCTRTVRAAPLSKLVVLAAGEPWVADGESMNPRK